MERIHAYDLNEFFSIATTEPLSGAAEDLPELPNDEFWVRASQVSLAALEASTLISAGRLMQGVTLPRYRTAPWWSMVTAGCYRCRISSQKPWTEWQAEQPPPGPPPAIAMGLVLQHFIMTVGGNLHAPSGSTVLLSQYGIIFGVDRSDGLIIDDVRNWNPVCPFRRWELLPAIG